MAEGAGGRRARRAGRVVPGAAAPVSGAGIWGWRAADGSWQLLEANAAPTASPALSSVTLAGPEAQGYLLGDRLLSLLLALAASVGNNLAVAAEVKADYLEAAVSYERGLGRLWDFEKAGDLEGWTARNVAEPGNPERRHLVVRDDRLSDPS